MSSGNKTPPNRNESELKQPRLNGGHADGQTRLIPVRRWPEIHEWPSEAGLRHLRFFCQTNGFADAFVCVGRRVLVDEQAFFRCARDQGERK